jgi:hypothetical protein
LKNAYSVSYIIMHCVPISYAIMHYKKPVDL